MWDMASATGIVQQLTGQDGFVAPVVSANAPQIGVNGKVLDRKQRTCSLDDCSKHNSFTGQCSIYLLTPIVFSSFK